MAECGRAKEPVLDGLGTLLVERSEGPCAFAMWHAPRRLREYRFFKWYWIKYNPLLDSVGVRPLID